MPVVAVPALAGVMAALLALLLLWGIQALIKALAALIPESIPVIGKYLHNLVLGVAGAAAAAAQWLMADLIRPVINFLLSPVFALINWLAAIRAWADTVSHELAWIVTSAIPQAIARASQIAHALVKAARAYAYHLYRVVHAYAVHLYHAATAYAYHLYRVVHAYAVHLYHAATAYAYHLYRVVHAYAVHLYYAARAYSLSLYHLALSTLRREIAAVEAIAKAEIAIAEKYADTAVATAVRALEHDITVATAAVIHVVDVDTVAPLAAAWPGVIDAIDSLEGVIGLDLPDIGAAVRAIPRAVPLDLTDALSIVGAISIPMLRYMSRCGVPNCRNLSSLGRELSNLLDDLAGGAFLALLVALAADPIGTAHFLNDNVAPLATDAINGAKSLLGV